MAFDPKAYLAKYREDHQHPVNRALHSVGIPMIVASLPIMPFNPLLGAWMFVFGWILQSVSQSTVRKPERTEESTHADLLIFA